ncbi:unnamed protein product [Nippostrongylus brasiliensis]|uniref:Sulfurtransferase n=1 Tax=Nippostrongylus brasiliensis TaxID=27835 RepID=A0A0N4YRL8_NIPBR|nr:unnamed protein product [Nippostrongylus brasiliensis]
MFVLLPALYRVAMLPQVRACCRYATGRRSLMERFLTQPPPSLGLMVTARMSVPDVVNVEWLAKQKDDVVLLDASYDMMAKPDPVEFKKKFYGKFETLMAEKPNSSYLAEHIPGAVHFNLDAAFYPSEFIRFDLYPADEFEKYIRLLGVNSGDHVVVYSRGSFAGMMWAARAWWAFKPGNWTAKKPDPSRLISFEELSVENNNGVSLFDDLRKINYLDARTAGQYSGKDPLGIPAVGATGSHLKGAKSVPIATVIGEKGIKSPEEIKLALKNANFDESLPTVTACNTGIQASLLTLVLSTVGKQARLYNGSMAEIGLRASQLIKLHHAFEIEGNSRALAFRVSMERKAGSMELFPCSSSRSFPEEKMDETVFVKIVQFTRANRLSGRGPSSRVPGALPRPSVLKPLRTAAVRHQQRRGTVRVLLPHIFLRRNEPVRTSAEEQR